MADVDATFTDLPLHRLADAALQRARDFGASHADVRIERLRSQSVALRDGSLEGAHDGEQFGLCVRVIVDGTWGFASTFELNTTAAVRTTEEAVRVAHVSAPLRSQYVELAPEPAYRRATWVSAYATDPLSVPLEDKVALLGDWSRGLAVSPVVAHVTAHVEQHVENKFYADLAGTSTTQQRVRVHPELEVHGERDGRIDSMRTIAPPVGRGWEYLTDGAYDWAGELAAMPDQLAEKLTAPSVEPGTYDLVIDPTNLWLTIHESIGHATELDRALGYEANFAGTSFATYDQLGSLQYGSPIMHVTGDRTAEHGLATVGYDDDGVEAQSWDIIRDGVLVGYQLDRSMAALKGFDRSNGCAFADSPAHVPIQRMANVSLQPAAGGPGTDGLIGEVERGLYIVGDKSWSIDMQRYNFQFTGQRFYRIENGELKGQVRDAAYQATTTDFWRSMSAVGGEQTWQLCGAFNCGKAQPAQIAAVSHGAPSALFRDVAILNTQAESGR